MYATRFLIPLLFLPAGLGLLVQSVAGSAGSTTVAQRLLSLALALFCPELIRMAIVDLNNIAAVSESSKDSRLRRFNGAVVSTVVLEAAGLYIALVSLQWGAIALIFSQIWFNLLAGIQLHPEQSPSIAPLGIAGRRTVLAANALGLGLMALWPIQAIRIWLAGGLLTLITLFFLIKYGWPQPAQQ